MSQPAWTTTLQQDLAAVREHLAKIEENVGDSDSVRPTRAGIKKAIESVEAMERKLQVGRCTAIAALEEL